MVNKEPSPNKAPSVARRLRLPQLQMVCMAGDGANFREMAEALHVTQPAITKMAQELERTLGAEVFDRSASGRRLTAFGLAVLPHAQRSLAALGQLEEELPRYRDGDQPALRIGSPSFTAAVLLARPVARWLQQTPGARVQMSDGVSVQLLAALQAGDLDCVIGSFDEGSSSDIDLAQLHFERLYDDHVTFVVHPDTPGRTRLNKLGQLLDLPWVIPPRDSQVWKVLRQAFTAAGLALPSGVLETSSVQAIGAILSEAPGTVGAMRVDAGRYLVRHDGLEMLPITPAIKLPQIGILRLHSAPPSVALDSLLTLVRAEVSTLIAQRPRRARAATAVR